jgi:hypothetical protein
MFAGDVMMNREVIHSARLLQPNFDLPDRKLPVSPNASPPKQFLPGGRVRWSRAWLRVHVTDLTARRDLEGQVGTVFTSTYDGCVENVRVIWRAAREAGDSTAKMFQSIPANQLEHVKVRLGVEGVVPQLDWMDAEHAAFNADSNFLYQWERGGQFTLSLFDSTAWLCGAKCIREQALSRPALWVHGEHWLAVYMAKRGQREVFDMLFYYVGLVGPKPEDDE